MFSLQLPNENWEPFEAGKKVTLSQCVRQEIGVKFNYLSLEVESGMPKKEKVESLGSELIHRGGGSREASSVSGIENDPKSSEQTDVNVKVVKKDPLKWFGFLVPNSLRQSQRHFSKAIEMSIEAANVQSEIRGLLGRRKVLLRQLNKIESTNGNKIESTNE